MQSLPVRRVRDLPPPQEEETVRSGDFVVNMESTSSSSASAASTSPASSVVQHERRPRPDNTRSSTDPPPSTNTLLPGLFRDKDKSDWAFPRPTSSSGSSHSRNRSPYSRSHLRSRSSGAALLSAPPMTRAHSLPNPHISKSFDPKSGSQSPMRSRSPAFRNEEVVQRSASWFETSSSATSLSGSGSTSSGSLGIEAIQEDSELDLTPRAQSSHSQSAQNSPLTQHSASFSRSASLNRRRPASPLYSSTSVSPTPSVSFPASVIDQGMPVNMSASTSSGPNSPALGPQKFNEPHPSQMLHHYASSSSFSTSIPSTPTSARSRSPSISSLDTIEDAPEEEEESEAQLELERIERLKLAAERAEAGEGDESDDGDGGRSRRRNGSLDMPRFRGMGRGSERKRWSICGGERRADLDLETIWED